MQRQALHRTLCSCSWLIVGLLLMVAIGVGCSSGTYRATNLPPELVAPPALDLETINLGGLAEHSVSLEVIQPGDVLDVSMVNDYSKLTTTTTPVRVADDGTVILPLVGKVSVGGMEVVQAEQAVNAQSVMRGIFRNPCITVAMRQCRTRKVTVVGAVNKPGPVELPRGASSLMTALIAAGGLSKEAGTEVEIRHTDSRQPPFAPQAAVGPNGLATLASYQQSPSPAASTAIKVDLTSATSGAVKVPDLCDGDVVHVVKRVLRPIYVIGLVRKPGEFPYPTSQEIRVLDALALAGGVSNPVAEDVVVIRKLPNAKEAARIAISIQAAKSGSDNLPLAPGDTITVEQTPLTVAVDAIQTFVRFSIGANPSWF
jgi:polysaccharide export outer membrane protein